MISSKLSCKDGGGWVSCCGWIERIRAGGGKNGLKPFITDAIPCRSSEMEGGDYRWRLV